jgi:hypothetical protein
MLSISRAGRALLLFAALPLASGCIVAAAGAGAAAGVYLSDRGASSLIDSRLPEVEIRAQSVLRAMAIDVTETRAASDGSRKEFRGRAADLDVTLELEARGTSTQVTATARRNAVEFDRAYARELVQRIVEQK